MCRAIRRGSLDAVDNADERVGDGGRDVRVVPEVRRGRHALGVAGHIGEAPERGVKGVAHEATGANLIHGAATASPAASARLAPAIRSRTICTMATHASVEVGCARDHGNGARLVVGGIGKRERDSAHEQAAAVVPLPRKAVSALERLARSVTDVEEPIDRVGTLVVPPEKSLADVLDVNTPQLTISVSDCTRHRRVIASRARRLAVANAAELVNAAGRAPRTGLVRHT